MGGPNGFDPDKSYFHNTRTASAVILNSTFIFLSNVQIINFVYKLYVY